MVYSTYDGSYADTFEESFFDKARINDLTEEDLKEYKDGNKITLHEGAIKYSHAVITGGEIKDDSVKKALKDTTVPQLNHSDETFLEEYLNFFKSLTDTDS